MNFAAGAENAGVILAETTQRCREVEVVLCEAVGKVRTAGSGEKM